MNKGAALTSRVWSKIWEKFSRPRYEETPDHHHDHLIDMKVVEFVGEEIEAPQHAIARRLGYSLVDHRVELYRVSIDDN